MKRWYYIILLAVVVLGCVYVYLHRYELGLVSPPTSGADDPPVARYSDMSPDKTLDTARDGALARTQTTLVSETKGQPQGFPDREFASRNIGGGVMNSRLIYAGKRLYMLIAAFPSTSARRDEDVNRFFNSLQILNK